MSFMNLWSNDQKSLCNKLLPMDTERFYLEFPFFSSYIYLKIEWITRYAWVGMTVLLSQWIYDTWSCLNKDS